MKLSNNILSGSMYFIIYLFLSIQAADYSVCKKSLKLGVSSSAHRDALAVAHVHLGFCKRYNVPDVYKIASAG